MATNPLCNNDCDSALGAVEFNYCNPEVNPSEIRRIFLSSSGASPFSDWAEATEWLTRINQTDTEDKNAIRVLTTIASKPAPSQVTKELSDGRTKVVRKDHSMNYLVDENNDVNYEFFRQLECSGSVRLWYETMGGKIYGGNEGISATMSGDEILNSGADEIAIFEGVITWKSKYSPERTNSPIFDKDFQEANGSSPGV